MAQHDPLDGFITYNELQHTSVELDDKSELQLDQEISDLSAMCEGLTWQDHLDINNVMLATSLVPESYLHLE